MKLLISAQGNQLTSLVDPRFGRAKYFIVYDLDNETYIAQDNIQNLNLAQGAGIQAGRLALDLGADAVITGHVGPKAFATLLAAKIKVYLNNSETVADAVDAYKNNQLTLADNADVKSHW